MLFAVESNSSPRPLSVQRAQPLLGTMVRIEITHPNSTRAELQEAATKAFQEIKRLQAKFNFHDEASELNSLNKNLAKNLPSIGGDLANLVKLALSFEKDSASAFSPWRKGECQQKLDLTGIAKGFIVDQTVVLIKRLISNASGVVNAGGDLRFFGKEPKQATIRLETESGPILQKILLKQTSVASSSPTLFERATSTVYPKSLAKHFAKTFTAVATANTCTNADAMTKVAMFGDEETIARCCAKYDASVFIFSSTSELVRIFEGS